MGTTVSIDDRSSEFIAAEIARGAYDDASSVVRAALRLLEEQNVKLARLREALIEGEESGLAEEFDLEDFLAARRAG